MDTQSHSQYIRNINDSVLHIVFIRKPLNLLLKKEVIFFEQNTVIIGNHRLYALFSDSENTYINKININKAVLIKYIQNRTVQSSVMNTHGSEWYLSQRMRVEHTELFNQLFSQFRISGSNIIREDISKRLVRTVLIFTESSDQLSRATDRVPGLPASPGYVQ